jgi:hypothetical protein
MSEIHETDIVAWSQYQAALLRRLAAGERVSDQVDWANVAEEIERVGIEQVHTVSSLLMQAIAYRLTAIAWPDARDVPNWQADARRFAIDAADRFTPAMRPRLDVARIYRRARRFLPHSVDGTLPLALPIDCPWSLEELLVEDER